jgi:glutathione S-transferase
MLLIGQFDSPFVRRVGIALKFYGLPFEHKPFSVFRDAELIAPYNPLRKVPTLVLDDGTVLTESIVCTEVIDEHVASEQASRRLLLPRSGALRREGLRLSALCTGTCEKAASLVYERQVREQRSELWTARCNLQVRETLASLEASCAKRRGAFVLDEHVSHADIALTTTFTFIDEAHPGYLDDMPLPALRELARRCEALPEFSSVKQPFFVPLAGQS